MRYTEARLQALADDMMADLDKETVDFTPNYDETTEEPTVLPAPFPNLLVNGSAGIAVGMATNVPPHNLRAVVDGCIWLIAHRHLRAIPQEAGAATTERIADLVREKTIEGISDLRDESDRDGMRIVIELKRGEVPEVILNNLYKHTQLQLSFGIIMLAIVGGRPKVMSLLEMIETFVEFRRDFVRRRNEIELKKAEARYHLLE